MSHFTSGTSKQGCRLRRGPGMINVKRYKSDVSLIRRFKWRWQFCLASDEIVVIREFHLCLSFSRGTEVQWLIQKAPPFFVLFCANSSLMPLCARQRRPWVPLTAAPRGAAQSPGQSMTSPSTNVMRGHKCHSVGDSHTADTGSSRNSKNTAGTPIDFSNRTPENFFFKKWRFQDFNSSTFNGVNYLLSACKWAWLLFFQVSWLLRMPGRSSRVNNKAVREIKKKKRSSFLTPPHNPLGRCECSSFWLNADEVYMHFTLAVNL